ncbi:hypothetical protein G5V58_02000 [Nocardioides anomalus]|uniref:Ig-like domain-containing protein n=1 Tax=Nocardioides anomalus TaxID=2712223 RepID=A0A6G6W8P3_9ACTN|nr:hypothetical protein [Nocardioides anomalus]QIG41708.1 hypothetical protein G5V58_02000 [Nocardioides anomalus]
MSMSATVDVSDSLDEARTRLVRSARALNGAWAAAVCLMAFLVVASLLLLLVAITIRPVYVVIWSVLLAATGYNVTRFWPRRVVRPGHVLGRRDRDALRGVLDPERTVAFPEVVRLVAQPELEVTEGELVVGMPLLACLQQGELSQLLRVAVAQAEVEDHRSVRWALRVAHGQIGRPLVGRRPRPSWFSAWFTETVSSQAAALEGDLGNWAGACERALVARSQAASDARDARDEVADAWLLLRTEWLAPAYERGRRHVAPFTGLRHFVEGADRAGWLARPRPWWPPTGVLADLVAGHEERVALDLDRRGAGLEPLTWDQHPAEVSVPQWRALVSRVLDTARRSSYDPAVTLDSVLRLVEQEGRAHAEKTVTRVLTAAISVAAVDSRHFVPTWSWPDGTRLDAEADGWTLPVETIVAEVLTMVRSGGGVERAYAELREALERLGVDVHEPLWLDDDRAPRPQRPVGSFLARQGLAARMVVLTDRTLHVFRDSHGPRLLQPRGPRDATVEMRKRMLTVWQGDTTDQVLTVDVADVRRARLGPAAGGLWWRLSLDTDGGTVVLRGRGDGQEVEAEVGAWLGRSVQRSWVDTAPGVRGLRHVLGLGGALVGRDRARTD